MHASVQLNFTEASAPWYVVIKVSLATMATNSGILIKLKTDIHTHVENCIQGPYQVTNNHENAYKRIVQQTRRVPDLS